NTVPTSVRCTPSTRMSRTVKGSKASAECASAARSSMCRIWSHAPAFIWRRRARCTGVSEESGKVIEKRQGAQHREHRHADALPDLENAVGDGTAFNNLGEIIHQVPAVE